MKKITLSLVVIALFILYSIHHRKEIAEIHIVPPTIFPSSTPNTELSPTTTKNGYRDGEYIGNVEDVFYGNLQVKAIIQNGKIADVQFLQYPNDRGESIEINTQMMPILKQEAIQAQTAEVDIVSGATDSSKGFIKSLNSALNQAK